MRLALSMSWMVAAGEAKMAVVTTREAAEEEVVKPRMSVAGEEAAMKLQALL